MSDKSYDAIVVGGGHHGLIIACYLQRAGMKTGIFELQSKLGGVLTREGGPVPGFRLNPRSNWTRFYGQPAYADFHLFMYLRNNSSAVLASSFENRLISFRVFCKLS